MTRAEEAVERIDSLIHKAEHIDDVRAAMQSLQIYFIAVACDELAGIRKAIEGRKDDCR